MVPVNNLQIPRGVYWNAETANFYDIKRGGMGSAFYDMWLSESLRFPQTQEEALQSLSQELHTLASAPKVPDSMIPAYLLLMAASVTPVAFQLAGTAFPAIDGIGITISMCVMTSALFLVGTLKAITVASRKAN